MAGLRKGLSSFGGLLIRSAVVLLCVEVACFAILFVRDMWLPADPRVRADVYANSAWAEAYFQELDASGAVAWKPYVYWARKPFDGRYININQQGRRETVPSSLSFGNKGKELTVFFFGGSTLWGTGARDSHTIPSLVVREMERHGVSVRAENLGESGFVSTQEAIAFYLMLRNGEIPDVAVFYDGVNDVFSAYQQREAGLPQNEFNRSREFGLVSGATGIGRIGWELFRKTSFYRLTEGVLRRSKTGGQDAGTEPESARTLPASTVATYLGNARAIRALAKEYGVTALFYWQPSVFQKPRLTPYERDVAQQYPGLETFVGEVYRLLAAEQAQEVGVRDLSARFKSFEDALFIDWMHIGEAGNQMIAEDIAQDVFELGQRRTGTARGAVVAPEGP